MRDGLIDPAMRSCARSLTRGEETNQRSREVWLVRSAPGRQALAGNALVRGSARSTMPSACLIRAESMTRGGCWADTGHGSRNRSSSCEGNEVLLPQGRRALLPPRTKPWTASARPPPQGRLLVDAFDGMLMCCTAAEPLLSLPPSPPPPKRSVQSPRRQARSVLHGGG